MGVTRMDSVASGTSLVIVVMLLFTGTCAIPVDPEDGDDLSGRTASLFTLGSLLRSASTNQSRIYGPSQSAPSGRSLELSSRILPSMKSVSYEDFPPYPGTTYIPPAPSGWGPKGVQRVVYVAIPLTALSAILAASQISPHGMASFLDGIGLGGADVGIGFGGAAALQGAGVYGLHPPFPPPDVPPPGLGPSLESVLYGGGIGGPPAAPYYPPSPPVGPPPAVPVYGGVGKYGNVASYGSSSYSSSVSSYGTTSGGAYIETEYGGGPITPVGPPPPPPPLIKPVPAYGSGYGVGIGVGGGYPPPVDVIGPPPPPPVGVTAGNLPCLRGAGYYRHPMYCNRFYRCVDGPSSLATGRFMIYEFNCPPGTVYSVLVFVCVWPYQPEAGSCFDMAALPPPAPPLPGPGAGYGLPPPPPPPGPVYGSGAVVPGPSYGAAIGAGLLASGYGSGWGGAPFGARAYDGEPEERSSRSDDGVVNGDGKAARNASNVAVVRKAPTLLLEDSERVPNARPRCTQVGFFPHPVDCTQFAQCWKSGTGRIVGYYYKCPPKTAFNAKVPVCGDPSRISNLSPSCIV